MEETLLNKSLRELHDTWALEEEELSHIREIIVNYTTRVLLDSRIKEEFDKELEDKYNDQ